MASRFAPASHRREPRLAPVPFLLPASCLRESTCTQGQRQPGRRRARGENPRQRGHHGLQKRLRGAHVGSERARRHRSAAALLRHRKRRRQGQPDLARAPVGAFLDRGSDLEHGHFHTFLRAGGMRRASHPLTTHRHPNPNPGREEMTPSAISSPLPWTPGVIPSASFAPTAG